MFILQLIISFPQILSYPHKKLMAELLLMAKLYLYIFINFITQTIVLPTSTKLLNGQIHYSQCQQNSQILNTNRERTPNSWLWSPWLKAIHITGH